jgi:GNAT superfamily N-acetyltransferase
MSKLQIGKMSISVRDATPEDAEFIELGVVETLAIENETSYGSLKSKIARAIAAREVRVAVLDGMHVGFLWHEFGDKTPFGVDYGNWGKRYCWVSYSFVSKEHRNKGIGTMLYEDVTQMCRNMGISQILLDVYTVNTDSVKFHAKKGFRPLLSIYLKEI